MIRSQPHKQTAKTLADVIRNAQESEARLAQREPTREELIGTIARLEREAEDLRFDVVRLKDKVNDLEHALEIEGWVSHD